MRFVLATRASRLALVQAELAARLLQAAWSDLEVECLEVETAGDRDLASTIGRFGRTGVFTTEVDEALLAGRAHAAVHSLKDVPTELPSGIALAGVLPRGPVEDAWLQPRGIALADLAPGSRVATGSARRAAMLRAERPDLRVVGMRGNVETRLRKLEEGEADAMILACAGLVRLGLERRITAALPLERFLPAPGQGAIGLAVRAGDAESLRRASAATDVEAEHEVEAERALLAGLRGGCNVPVGACARVVESTLHLRARVLSLDGAESLEGAARGSRDEAAAIGRRLAGELLGRGAARLVAEARA